MRGGTGQVVYRAGYREGGIPVYYPARVLPQQDGYALPLDVQAPRVPWTRSWGLPWGVLGRVLLVSATEVVARWVRQGRLQGRLQHPQHGPTEHQSPTYPPQDQ